MLHRQSWTVPPVAQSKYNESCQPGKPVKAVLLNSIKLKFSLASFSLMLVFVESILAFRSTVTIVLASPLCLWSKVFDRLLDLSRSGDHLSRAFMRERKRVKLDG
jgi:hypothetical protein